MDAWLKQCNVNTYKTWRTASAFRQGRALLSTLRAQACLIRAGPWLAALPLAGCKVSSDWPKRFLSNNLCSALAGSAVSAGKSTEERERENEASLAQKTCLLCAELLRNGSKMTLSCGCGGNLVGFRIKALLFVSSLCGAIGLCLIPPPTGAGWEIRDTPFVKMSPKQK